MGAEETRLNTMFNVNLTSVYLRCLELLNYLHYLYSVMSAFIGTDFKQ